MGVERNGALVYVGGPAMSISSLARLLARAGCERAMELDINTDWVSFNFYWPNPRAPASVGAAKLLDTMVRSPYRYLVPDERDFIAMFAAPHRAVH